MHTDPPFVVAAPAHPSLDGAIVRFCDDLRAETRWFGRRGADARKPSPSLVRRLESDRRPGCASPPSTTVRSSAWPASTSTAPCGPELLVAVAAALARRRGVALALGQAIVARAHAAGIERIVLHTSDRGAELRDLGAALGFQVVDLGRRPARPDPHAAARVGPLGLRAARLTRRGNAARSGWIGRRRPDVSSDGVVSSSPSMSSSCRQGSTQGRSRPAPTRHLGGVIIVVAASGEGGDRQRRTCNDCQWLHAHVRSDPFHAARSQDGTSPVRHVNVTDRPLRDRFSEPSCRDRRRLLSRPDSLEEHLEAAGRDVAQDHPTIGRLLDADRAGRSARTPSFADPQRDVAGASPPCRVTLSAVMSRTLGGPSTTPWRRRPPTPASGDQPTPAAGTAGPASIDRGLVHPGVVERGVGEGHAVDPLVEEPGRGTSAAVRSSS